jgi:hypothetical protein
LGCAGAKSGSVNGKTENKNYQAGMVLGTIGPSL